MWQLEVVISSLFLGDLLLDFNIQLDHVNHIFVFLAKLWH
jgi:hypothetical protein